jgi:membrane protein
VAERTDGRARPEARPLGQRLLGEFRLVGLAAWRGLGELYNSEGLTHAAAIAYYALLSLFPFLLLLLSVFGALTADLESRDAVLRWVFQYFPRQFDFITRQLDAFRDQRVPLGIGGLLVLTWAALGVFGAVSSAIDYAWGVERRRSFLMHRLLSFLMMLSAGVVFAIALALASLARVAESNWFWVIVERSPGLVWLTGAAAEHGATLLLIVCVALLFYFIPNTEIRFRDVWPGAIATGLLWRVALAGFSWYARDLARWNVIHGSIAAVVVFLFWVYISAVILIYGAEMTAAYARLQAAALAHPELKGEAGSPAPKMAG